MDAASRSVDPCIANMDFTKFARHFNDQSEHRTDPGPTLGQELGGRDGSPIGGSENAHGDTASLLSNDSGILVSAKGMLYIL